MPSTITEWLLPKWNKRLSSLGICFSIRYKSKWIKFSQS